MASRLVGGTVWLVVTQEGRDDDVDQQEERDVHPVKGAHERE